MDEIIYIEEMNRPNPVNRIVRPGHIVTNSPRVVRCVWTKVNTDNLNAIPATLEQMESSKGCWMHKGCKGHLTIDVDTGTYMIPYGYASGDELIQSDGFVMNKAVLSGDKSMSDMADFCFKRLAGKNGILRKACNGTRPTNTMRFLLSPPSGRTERGTIEVPKQLINKGMFVYISKDGMCSMRSMKEGDYVVFGRCPSQGKDSALPMRVIVAEDDTLSVKIPLEVCNLNNADFDGDEGWFYYPVTDASASEIETAWHNVWNSNTIPSINTIVMRNVPKDSSEQPIDPVMYSTMTFEEMSTHPGGEMYKALMLKPTSWNQMYKTMMSRSYWQTFVLRSKAGIVNTMMSRLGVSAPYTFMSLGMMLGTCVSTNGSVLSIRSPAAPELPYAEVSPFVSPAVCSSAMTKLTKVMYQRGIDMSKHGLVLSKKPAVELLASGGDMCYSMSVVGGAPSPVMSSVSDAVMRSETCTNLTAIGMSNSGHDLLGKALTVVSMVEVLDDVDLTDDERMAAAYLIAFLSVNTNSVMNTEMFEVMYKLKLDWYTSITCSDIRWIRGLPFYSRRYLRTTKTMISSILATWQFVLWGFIEILDVLYARPQLLPFLLFICSSGVWYIPPIYKYYFVKELRFTSSHRDFLWCLAFLDEKSNASVNIVTPSRQLSYLFGPDPEFMKSARRFPGVSRLQSEFIGNTRYKPLDGLYHLKHEGHTFSFRVRQVKGTKDNVAPYGKDELIISNHSFSMEPLMILHQNILKWQVEKMSQKLAVKHSRVLGDHAWWDLAPPSDYIEWSRISLPIEQKQVIQNHLDNFFFPDTSGS
ncbi:hypothetical protein F5Y03DRAFT_44989 [Xylaria venustula]|nr:hypothetical protein F5Y03DRAFT_44989 [Xylaria venustula]